MVSVSAAAGICAFWPNGVTKKWEVKIPLR